MGICPNCKSQVELSAVDCSSCGAPLGKTTELSGTLNVDALGLFHAPQEPASAEQKLETPGGTLQPSDLPAVPHSPTVTSSSEMKTATDNFMDEQAAAGSDDRKTIRLPDGLEVDSLKPSSTWIYDDEERKLLSEGKSSSDGTGSEGQLRKVWEEAIGSSGKDSKQSLRHDRAEASDSVFRRVATRKIADANDSNSAGADYQIQNKVGEGGMGIVFSAIQTAVNRTVAIKSIKAEKSKLESARKQFFYEAEITADLDHPNIPPIYELGTTGDGLLFYSMKLIQGTEWQKLLGKKTREENLEIFSKISDAVAFAHSKNVIHRDLKPDNVMLGTFGEVYLTDWGLGVDLGTSTSLDFGGTPDFMAPEMAANRRSKIGKHSDVYLLGAILFQLITGMPPHIGRTPYDRLDAAKRNEIANTKIEDPLLDIARVAMSTNISDRYASVAELQAAIAEVRRHAESISLAERSAETAKAAEVSKDYDQFTRAIYGFRDAIEMWNENKFAKSGLQRARFAYGNCAYSKGSYDLVLQTVDRSVSEESQLYDKAAKAKLAVEQREQRFKTLKNVFLSAIVGFLLISTALAGFASWQWKMAVEQRKIADEKTAEATKSAIEEAKQRKIADDKTVEATKSAVEEAKQRKIADDKTVEATNSAIEEAKQRKIADDKTVEATNSAIEEAKQRKIADDKTVEATKLAIEEAKQRKIAEKKTAQIRIEESKSRTALAKSQLEQFDTQGAAKLIEGLTVKGEDDVFAGKQPNFDAWPLKRIQLLSNADLPRVDFKGSVKAIDYVRASNIGVAGTETGNDATLYTFSLIGSQLKVGPAVTRPNSRIYAVAVSPKGDEAIVTLKQGDSFQMLAWPLIGEQDPIEVKSVVDSSTTQPFQKSFQHLIYSPDGSQILAGINGGIWKWNRGSNWYSDLKKSDNTLQNVRGKLNQLQWMDSKYALALSSLNGTPALYLLEPAKSDDVASKKQASISVELPKEIESSLTAAVWTGVGTQLMLGTNDGSVYLSEYKLPTASDSKERPKLVNLVELPKKHQTAIKHLSYADGAVISMSDEAVAHVWRVNGNEKDQVAYDTFVSGIPSTSTTTNNLVQTVFLSKELIAGIDKEGAAVVWNLERQKQRRLITRTSESSPSGAEEYTSPVVNVFSRGGTEQVISVDSKGVVDLWDLQTGKTAKLASSGGLAQRYLYHGHTPGAEYVDSAVDLDARIAVTSASLKNAERKYLGASPEMRDDKTQMREFCVWDLASGNMLHRWQDNLVTTEDQGIAPRISLLNHGKEILVASQNETRIMSLDGNLLEKHDDKGTLFALPSPTDKDAIAMIKDSGQTWLWNRKSPWNPPKQFATDDREGAPAKAIWTEDGKRLFVVYNTFKVWAYDLVGNELNGKPLHEKMDSTVSDRKAWKAFTDYRLPYHFDLDLAVTSSGTVDKLYLDVRIPGSQPRSKTNIAEIARGTPSILKAAEEDISGLTWLDVSNAVQPKFTNSIHDRFSLNNKGRDRATSRITSGGHTFISMRSGTIYDIVGDSNRFLSLGSQAMVSVTCDWEGKNLFNLQEDGSILRLEISDDAQPKWTRLSYSAEGCNRISVSPDGKQMAMSHKSNVLKIVDAISGESIPDREFANVAKMIWDPNSKASPTIAIAHGDGTIAVANPNGVERLSPVTLGNGDQIESLSFFTENFCNGSDAIEYVMVQSRSAEASDTLHFVPRKGGNVFSQKLGTEQKTVTVSPTDSVLVTGDSSGAVKVWFASPTWEKVDPLYGLQGHQGASIECISFSRDGTTIVTTDSAKRVFGWMSKDKTISPD